MLRAIDPFFELVIYTRLQRLQAELILDIIEKETCFFEFIVPQTYCKPFSNNLWQLKDLSIFMGSRKLQDLIYISSSGYDCLLQQYNAIPIDPFTKPEDSSLLLLETYLLSMRWDKDVRVRIKSDFYKSDSKPNLPNGVVPSFLNPQQ